MILEFQTNRALAQQRFHLFEGVDHERARLRCPLFARRQRVSVALAGHHQVCAVATNSLQLGWRRHFRNKDSCRIFQLHGGKRHRRAVIAA